MSSRCCSNISGLAGALLCLLFRKCASFDNYNNAGRGKADFLASGSVCRVLCGESWAHRVLVGQAPGSHTQAQSESYVCLSTYPSPNDCCGRAHHFMPPQGQKKNLPLSVEINVRVLCDDESDSIPPHSLFLFSPGLPIIPSPLKVSDLEGEGAPFLQIFF